MPRNQEKEKKKATKLASNEEIEKAQAESKLLAEQAAVKAIQAILGNQIGEGKSSEPAAYSEIFNKGLPDPVIISYE